MSKTKRDDSAVDELQAEAEALGMYNNLTTDADNGQDIDHASRPGADHLVSDAETELREALAKDLAAECRAHRAENRLLLERLTESSNEQERQRVRISELRERVRELEQRLTQHEVPPTNLDSD